MSKYKGLFTFDEDNHRYVPIAQADGIIDTMDHEPAEPLIKDEKVRKAVRAWAEANRDVSQVMFSKDVSGKSYSYLTDTDSDAQIKFNFVIDDELDVYEVYTITELCGEEEKC